MSRVAREHLKGQPKVTNKSSYPTNKSNAGHDYAKSTGSSKPYAGGKK